MYNNWNRSVAKKYLFALLALFFTTFIISVSLLFALRASKIITIDVSTMDVVLMALAGVAVPVSSFTGFCVAFIRVDQLNTKQSILMVLFCVPVVLVIIPFGLIMLVPTVSKCFKLLKE